MIRDATQDAVEQAMRGVGSSRTLTAGPIPKAFTATHAAVLRRIGQGLVLGPWSNVLVYGPKFWPKREHKALIQLVRAGVLRVARVSGPDMTAGHAASVVPPSSEFYYEIMPEDRLYSAAGRDRARRRRSPGRR